MRIFIKDILLFLAFIGTYFGINYALNYYFITTTSPNIKANLLAMGDSHMQAAFDPSEFHSAHSVSQAVEPYFVTYWKLKNIVKRSEIDTLILGFSYNNFSVSYDEVLNNLWCLELFKRIYPIAELNSIRHLDIDLQNYYIRKFRNMCIMPRKEHNFYIGNYHGLDTLNNKLANYKDVTERHFPIASETQDEVGISKTSIDFFNKIIAFCRQKGIELILIEPPLHKNYLKEVPKNIRKLHKTLKDQVAEQGITILDYSIASYGNEDFYDADHLNKRGARKFSRTLKKDLALLNFKAPIE